MNSRRFVSLFATLVLAITVSGSALADGGRGGGGHGGRGHGGGHGGGGHGHHGGGHFGGGHGHHGGGGHFGLGVFFGPTFGWYYPGPSYYYPSGVGVPSAPVYIEQGGEGYAAQQAYWYYCVESKTYYPYVKQCLGEWQRVPAQPPPNP